MTQQGVTNLMESSKNHTEWKANTIIVKQAFEGDYPSFWYNDIIVSGLMDRVLGEGSSQLKIVVGADAINAILNRQS